MCLSKPKTFIVSKETQPFPWLYRIAVNTAISFIKRIVIVSISSLENLQEDRISGKIAEILSSRKALQTRHFIARITKEKLDEALQKLSVKHIEQQLFSLK